MAAALALAPAMALAQGAPQHLVLITGLGGEPAYTRSFAESAAAIYDAAVRWGVADSNRTWLAENPASDRARIRGRADRAGVAAAFAALGRRVRPGEVVLVVLIGHGSGQGRESKVNLMGPDPEAWEYEQWLRPLGRATVVFVNASSASGGFLPVLAAPGRIVVTSTRASTERNESVFHTHFARGLAGGEADADKDGRVSVLGGELARDRGGLRLERAGVVGAEELDVQGGVDDERDHHDRAGRQQDLAPDRSEQVRNPIDTSSPPARSAAETTGL
jgi:hypothetical protein